jgi:hypothetical protein
MRTHLVVANQTLASEALLEEVGRRIAAGPARFYVLVPATPQHRTLFTWDEDASWRAARERLDTILSWLRDRGAEADGEIGDRDPVAAVRDAIRRQPIDEIILSTLPLGSSRWLRQDVGSRLGRDFNKPVVVVTATSSMVEVSAPDGSWRRSLAAGGAQDREVDGDRP